MEFTTAALATSFAAYLKSYFPGVNFEEDETQQALVTPCMFLQQRKGNIRNKINSRFLRTIGFTLTYLEDFNEPDMQQKYTNAAEILDYCLETFPYTNGGETQLMRTYDREAVIGQNSMTYNFNLQVFVYPSESGVKMMTYTYHEELQNEQ